MKQFKIVILLLVLLSACSTTSLKNSPNFDFIKAQEKFLQHFPDKYPPTEVKLPLNDGDKRAIQNMAQEVAKYLVSNNVNNELNLNKYEVVISSDGKDQLNKIAKKLKLSQITFKYDGLYFAKNPFSAGTFNETENTLLISHEAMANPAQLEDVINHELVHIETYQRKQKKLPSLFYCKFTGEQFAPHYLSCDEMNAYNEDLKRLIMLPDGKSLIAKKIKAAKMHTNPVPELIERLFIDSAKLKGDSIIIKGMNAKGSYQLEFPRFSCENPQQNIEKLALDYTNQVKIKANDYIAFISEVENANQ